MINIVFDWPGFWGAAIGGIWGGLTVVAIVYLVGRYGKHET